MADSTFFKGLAIWFAGLALFGLVVFGVAGVTFLSDDRSHSAMDDLHISNNDNETHRIHVEVTSANGSNVTVSETVRVEPDERISWENATAYGHYYRLVVTVGDREPESFNVEGPDDLCTTEIWIESNGTVETGMLCA
ncbi:hypothetical protein [Halorussus amylolyticus]|uniref:hypothetical protein n=1 Tax=Halorussus amylolyticus TaxID=1126242 RepID=UPI001052E722|nr:hypothetical protein [Halorussus amylolyticus]